VEATSSTTRQGQLAAANETGLIKSTFFNLKFHLEWRVPSRNSASPFDWACTLHVHAPVKTLFLHSILVSVLRKPQPKSGRPYVQVPIDINNIVLHPSGTLLHSPSLSLDKRYRIKCSSFLSVRIVDGLWSQQPSLDSFKNLLSLLSREPSIIAGAGAAAEAVPCVDTVEIRLLDMHSSHLNRWLQFVSRPDLWPLHLAEEYN
jgi:hypothetical protein